MPRKKKSSEPSAKHKRERRSEQGEIDPDIPRAIDHDWIAETVSTPEWPDDPHPDLANPKKPKDDIAELIGEHTVVASTSDQDPTELTEDEVTPGELGGPFVVTDARIEFATDTDATNPPDAEPLPRPVVSAQPPAEFIQQDAELLAQEPETEEADPASDDQAEPHPEPLAKAAAKTPPI
jgi:hypothetical protein